MGTAKPATVLENPWLRLDYNLEGQGLRLVYKEKTGVDIEGGHLAVDVNCAHFSTR